MTTKLVVDDELDFKKTALLKASKRKRRKSSFGGRAKLISWIYAKSRSFYSLWFQLILAAKGISRTIVAGGNPEYSSITREYVQLWDSVCVHCLQMHYKCYINIKYREEEYIYNI